MPMDATSLLGSQVGAAAAGAYLINALQRSKRLPWITEHSTQINAAVRAVLAFGATLGISAAWNPTEHTLLISGLSLPTILHGGWQFFEQYAFTHVIGKVIEQPTPVTPQGPIPAVPVVPVADK